MKKKMGMKLNQSCNDIFLYNRQQDKRADLSMWFVFPGPESFALSSLGYLWLYKQIDETHSINIERVYSDTTSTVLHKESIDLIAFSLSFDMDFIEILRFMEKNQYPFKSEQRNDSIPLMYAGGPVITANPRLYDKIFDFMVIGDGEDINIEIANILKNCKNKTKKEKLTLLANIEGIYVPSLKQKSINKITKKIPKCIYTPIISENAYFKNTFIIEVERGCANRCGFCLASYINLPIRFVPKEEIISAIELGLKHTNKIALLGAQVTAHPDFEEICRYIHNKIKNGEHIEIGVSSLRVDSFKQEIVQTLVDAGQKNLTLAIEAGSERLRNVINKNLTESQIFKAIDVAKNCGLKGIKFYGMIGIPTETEEDIKEIIALASKIKTKYKGMSFSFGFSTFVPKPNTPFQWIGRQDEKILENKSNYLKKELHKLGMQASISSPKWDYYQAVLSRGDANLTDYLIDVYKLGGKLGAFKKAAKMHNIDTNYYAQADFDYYSPLPWDIININPGKEFLINECKKLLNY